MNLYQYKLVQIKSGIKDLLDLFQLSESSWIEQAQMVAEMKFRDRAGRYWYVDVYENDWFYYENGKWLLTSEVPDVLEGLIPLFPVDAQLPEIMAEEQDVMPESSAESPVKALEDIQRKIRVDYQDGKLPSRDAEMISRRHLLIDQQGIVWTIGLQSGDWYRIENRAWKKVQAPPAKDQLLKLAREKDCSDCGQPLEGSVICPACGHENPPEIPDLSDEAYGRLVEFFLLENHLPEDVTSPWQPPAGIPTSMKVHFRKQKSKEVYCPHCNELLESGWDYCPACGSQQNKE